MYFVRPENIMLLCSVSQRGRRKKGIGGGENKRKRMTSPIPLPFPIFPRARKQLIFQLVLWASSFHTLLAWGHFLLVLVNDFVRG